MTEQAKREPAFQWGGLPVYRCAHYGPSCRFERLNDLAAVERHEAEKHAPPAAVVRESPIVGPSGERVLVAERPPAPAGLEVSTAPPPAPGEGEPGTEHVAFTSARSTVRVRDGQPVSAREAKRHRGGNRRKA